MKYEPVWDYSECQIGHPCNKCVDTCSFKTPKCDESTKNKEMETDDNGH